MSQEPGSVTMKLVIDTNKRKVLFAEAGKLCVDLIIGFLTLPLATVVSLVTDESMVGSIGTLYTALKNLGYGYRLDASTDFELPVSDPDYVPGSDVDSEYTDDDDDDESDGEEVEPETSMLGYVWGIGKTRFIIMDDLSVEPVEKVSAIELLKKFDVKDVSQIEERVVTLDTKMAVALLEASLKSKTVLTDVFVDGKD